MKNIVTFDHWMEDPDAPFASGASEKRLLINTKTSEKGIFKFPKLHTDGKYTREHISEQLASELAHLIKVPCAKVDLGTYKGQIGSMSYMVLNSDVEELQHGLDYIANKHPSYNADKFMDMLTNEIYSIQMILECIKHMSVQKEFMKIPIFDCLIGNSDRHHSNWGIIIDKNTHKAKVSPLYDNGSSLGCYVRTQDIQSHFTDANRFKALVFSRSRSRIGWENIKKPRHFELLEYIKDEFYKDTIEIVQNIQTELTEDIIDELLMEYEESCISLEEKQLICKFLKVRRRTILSTYGL